MTTIPVAEILERLKSADGNTSVMIERFGLDEWTELNAMALAFYAARFDDPEKALGVRLDFVGEVVRVYGRRMPMRCSLEFLVSFKGLDPGAEDLDRLFMDSQDYLQRVIDLHGEEYGGMTDEAIIEVGRHLCFSLASACMGYDSQKRAFEAGAELAGSTLDRVLNHSTYQTD